MQELIVDLGQNADQLQDAVRLVLDLLSEIPPEARSWTLGSTNSLDDLTIKAGTVAEFSKKVSQLDAKKFLMVPNSRLSSLREHLSSLTSQLRKVANEMDALKGAGGVTRFDSSSGVLSAPNGVQMALQQGLQNVQAHVDQALEAYGPIGAATRPRGIGEFMAASRALTDKAGEASRQVDEAGKTWNNFVQMFRESEAQSELIKSAASESERILGEAEKARKTIEENEQKAAAAATQVESVRGQAAALQAQVQDYAQQFESFQKQLDSRSEAVVVGNEKVETLQQQLSEKEQEIDRLIKKSEDMLGVSTVAGLSATYKDQVNLVDTQLKSARYFYYFSIAILILSVAAALNLLEFIGIGLAPLPTFTESTPTGSIAVQALAGLGSRGLLILPALLLATFAAHRHSALFRLREEYGHKYTMAASVEGFKKQAPDFEQQIAAAVFTELLLNPASTMDKHSSEPTRNGFIDKLIMPRVEEALKRAASIQEG